MKGYFYTSKNFLWRCLIIIAAVIFLLIVGVGGAVAVNYKHFGNLFKVVSLINSRYLEPVNVTTMMDGAIQGVVKSLNDPYSVYLDPKMFNQLQEQITGTFGGLGILVTIKDGYLAVVRSYPDTPAEEAGISADDIIVKINGRDTKGLDLETAVGLMRGEVGTRVTLTIARQGLTKPKNVILKREEINIPTVEGYILPGTKIGYLAVAQFTKRTPKELDDKLTMLKKQGMQGILLDLRDNPGGDLKAAVEVAEYFVPRGPVVYVDYRSGKDETYFVRGHNLRLPLVVLINRNSASAAEILAGAIKDTGTGVLVGERTFGKGIVQEVFKLDNGAGLKLTTARYLTPAKRDIHKKGIEPDLVITQESNDKRDLQLSRAIEILQEKIISAA